MIFLTKNLNEKKLLCLFSGGGGGWGSIVSEYSLQ